MWYGIGMREKASILTDLSNVLGAVGLSNESPITTCGPVLAAI